MNQRTEANSLSLAVGELVDTLVDVYSGEGGNNPILKGALRDLRRLKYGSWELGPELPEQVGELLDNIRMVVGPAVRTDIHQLLESELKKEAGG